MSILQQANAPLATYNNIVRWARSYGGEEFKHLVGRETFVRKIVSRYNLDHMRSELRDCYLPSLGATIKLTCHDFLACVLSLLSNEELMKPENLLIDPCDPSKMPDKVRSGQPDGDSEGVQYYLEDSGPYGDIDTGSAYCNAWFCLLQCMDQVPKR